MLKNYFQAKLLATAFILSSISLSAQITPCESGFSDIYPCLGVNLYKFMPANDIGGGIINDSWGWKSPVSGKEYAIQGKSTGTAFIDISDPSNPIYLGDLPTHSFFSLWRDVKVYDNHAFVVSEAAEHGMQVIDLLQLDDVENPPVLFEALVHYPNFGNAHNIAINEESGYAYAVGSQTYSGGLHFINIQDPANPVAAGGFEQDGYTHDVQVVMYQGSDPDYIGKEIAFASNEDTFTIIDVDDKEDPFQISRTEYVGNRYAHQGWLTEDHRYFLHNDELDELEFGHNTRTYIWDIEDLDEPVLLGFYESTSSAIDHNLYVKGNHVYLANYTSGLRVLRLNEIGNIDIEEVGFFDIIPANDDVQFAGSWNVYPYFESGTMILSNMYVGFYVLQPDFDPLMSTVNEVQNQVFEIYPNPASSLITIQFELNHSTPIEIFDFTGKRVLVNSSSANQQVVMDISSLKAGMYLVRAEGKSQKLVVN